MDGDKSVRWRINTHTKNRIMPKIIIGLSLCLILMNFGVKTSAQVLTQRRARAVQNLYRNRTPIPEIILRQTISEHFDPKNLHQPIIPENLHERTLERSGTRERIALPVTEIPPLKASPKTEESLRLEANSGKPRLSPVLERGEINDVQKSTELLQKFIIKNTLKYAEISRDLKDYSCTLYKRERMNGILRPQETIQILLREKPFSVYMRFISAPESYKGREIIYWDGHYGGSLVATKGGKKLAYINRLVGIDSNQARAGSSHRITEMGFRQMLRQFLELAEKIDDLSIIEAWFYDDASINGRPCYALRMDITTAKTLYETRVVEIFIDKEYELPTRLALYGVGPNNEQPFILMEEYIYVIHRMNCGLQDIHFNYLNPHYKFAKRQLPGIIRDEYEELHKQISGE